MRSVYFFDEFDAVGPRCGFNDDVGEVSRVLSIFLQMINQEIELKRCCSREPSLRDLLTMVRVVSNEHP